MAAGIRNEIQQDWRSEMSEQKGYIQKQEKQAGLVPQEKAKSTHKQFLCAT